jgi:hypothetical protein
MKYHKSKINYISFQIFGGFKPQAEPSLSYKNKLKKHNIKKICFKGYVVNSSHVFIYFGRLSSSPSIFFVFLNQNILDAAILL